MSLVLQVRREVEILESPCPTGPPLERLKVKPKILIAAKLHLAGEEGSFWPEVDPTIGSGAPSDIFPLLE